MNKKGFMMAEVIVVASVILVTLVGLYVSYNKIFSIYNKRVDYYDVATLYKLAEIKQSIDLTDMTSWSEVYIGDGDIVYYVDKGDLNDTYLIEANKTFLDYTSFLSKSLDIDSQYVLLMERCITDNNCKYAYLEVYDE